MQSRNVEFGGQSRRKLLLHGDAAGGLSKQPRAHAEYERRVAEYEVKAGDQLQSTVDAQVGRAARGWCHYSQAMTNRRRAAGAGCTRTAALYQPWPVALRRSEVERSAGAMMSSAVEPAASCGPHPSSPATSTCTVRRALPLAPLCKAGPRAASRSTPARTPAEQQRRRGSQEPSRQRASAGLTGDGPSRSLRQYVNRSAVGV